MADSDSETPLLQRQLDTIERMGNTAGPTYAVQYRGTIDEANLSHAFDLLRCRYPALRARISADGDVLYLPQSYDIGGLILKKLIDSYWQRDAVTDWESSRSLAQLVLFRGEDRGVVALRMNHAIADADAELHLFSELWSLYDEMCRGNNVHIDEHDALPRRPCEILHERWPHFAENYRAQDDKKTKSERVSAKTSEIVQRTIKLTRDDTELITEASRASHTTINSLLSSAIMLALRELSNGSETPAIRLNTVVNLRNHVTPKVGPTETTNFVGGHHAIFRSTDPSDLISLSTYVRKKILDGIRDGHVEPLGFERRGRDHAVGAAEYDRLFGVDNLGRIPRFRHPDDMYLDEFFYITRSKRMPSGNDGLYVPYTYDGQLKVLCWLPATEYSPDKASTLIDSVTKNLLSVIG